MSAPELDAEVAAWACELIANWPPPPQQAVDAFARALRDADLTPAATPDAA